MDCGLGYSDINCGQKTGEMKSNIVREEIKYCELEAENNAVRSRIEFWVEWRYFQFLIRDILPPHTYFSISFPPFFVHNFCKNIQTQWIDLKTTFPIQGPSPPSSRVAGSNLRTILIKADRVVSIRYPPNDFSAKMRTDWITDG